MTKPSEHQPDRDHSQLAPVVDPPRESIAALIARLGPPPEVVLQHWQQQWQAGQASGRFAGVPLSPYHLAVDRYNRLIPLASRTAGDVAVMMIDEANAARSHRPVASRRRGAVRRGRRTVLRCSAALVCLLVILSLLYRLPSEPRSTTADHRAFSEPPRPHFDAPRNPPTEPLARVVDDAASPAAGAFSLHWDPETTPPTELPQESGNSLGDPVFPTAELAGSLDDLLDPVEEPLRETRDDAPETDARAASESDGSLGAAPQRTPEAGQEEVSVTSRPPAVSLLPIDAAGEATLLLDQPASRIELEVPAGDCPVTILQTEKGRWEVFLQEESAAPDRADPLPVARIETTAPPDTDATQTVWKWTDAAAERRWKLQDVHYGRLRLRTAAGPRKLYLRESRPIDPVVLRLDQADRRLTWSLESPPHALATRLDIDVDVPDGVRFDWVEAPAGQLARRMRAVARWTAEEDATIELRTHFDIQTGRQLVCRQRTMIQLVPSLPWRAVSLPGVEQAIERLIGLHQQNQLQLERFRAHYAEARRTEQRQLRPQRELLEQRGRMLEATIERLSKTVNLMSQLDQAAHLHLNLSTAWPDGYTQPLLTTLLTTDDVAEPTGQR
ncbi:hypothetical protein [Roseimaritima sediminicola]|uniref:hypothetical protein n=1 Tax=Roseimaritima sediminicola TaxID=2662066 RepID=UPI001298283A|nr:hypothetical protein [Roseimaritima sediminicola]